ncbi:phytanoyl-CoA dioxygenase-like protein [Lojkania enalia]|uniref:Phytanoyl-CoA dioxygenase-like protein n=1 Tax=Lojkania enalia TaxID=147567 RepID=A0A9P4NAE4_9PLEO|nr:phytanoyl-CoA dioxygenase-like protein [Didymosphaeria enalia]
MNGTIHRSSSAKINDAAVKPIPSRLFSVDKAPSFEDFKSICSESKLVHYPLASKIETNVPIYDLPPFSSLTASQKSALQDEWYHILISGPGVFVTKNLYRSLALLEKVNTIYSNIIQQEKQNNSTKGDHFASSGQNDRIWNSFSKHCFQEADSFIEYYSNPYLPLISASWLGPHHRLTAQVNIVKSGAEPQISHRDYHLGFQTFESCSRFPKAVQVASQFLTLQGAVAHSNMPLESGPTRLLPFSQMFEDGYIAYRIQEFQDYFLEKYVSVPLQMGDGLFFNPALFHAAGRNESEGVMRSANLLQVSSAFGKPMESIDTLPLIERCWDGLMRMFKENGMSDEVKAVVGNIGEGYPFPTNLDRRVPETTGMAPESEQGILVKGLEEGLGKEAVLGVIRKMREDSRA